MLDETKKFGLSSKLRQSHLHNEQSIVRKVKRQQLGLGLSMNPHLRDNAELSQDSEFDLLLEFLLIS